MGWNDHSPIAPRNIWVEPVARADASEADKKLTNRRRTAHYVLGEALGDAPLATTTDIQTRPEDEQKTSELLTRLNRAVQLPMWLRQELENPPSRAGWRAMMTTRYRPVERSDSPLPPDQKRFTKQTIKHIRQFKNSSIMQVNDNPNNRVPQQGGQTESAHEPVSPGATTAICKREREQPNKDWYWTRVRSPFAWRT